MLHGTQQTSAVGRPVRTIHFLALLGALMLAGCASTPQTDCTSLSCMRNAASVELASQCSRDLFWYPQKNRQDQQAITSLYRYPLTSTQTFFDWVSRGGSGPTPAEWCEEWARQQVLVSFESR